MNVIRTIESDQKHAEPATTLPVFYSPAYTQSECEFDTTRKATWVASSLQARPITGVTLTAPVPLTQTDLEGGHAPAYVKAVRAGQPRALAESSGLEWDPRVWDAVCASNGGAVAAAKAAWQSRAHAGSLSSGLHHASVARGNGFCTFNGLALAARAVLDAGARRVLILDLDAHCGGGTNAIVWNWAGVVHLDISVSRFDHYQADPSTATTLDIITDARMYLPTLRKRLSNLRSTEFDLVIYNAGVDPHQHCDIGGLRGITSPVLAEREQIVFEWARGHRVPVAFVLAGGYVGDALSRDALVELHRQTVAAAALDNANATLTTDNNGLPGWPSEHVRRTP
jgi:acetoin utilization deacetylase AcuC-like enzyme